MRKRRVGKVGERSDDHLKQPVLQKKSKLKTRRRRGESGSSRREKQAGDLITKRNRREHSGKQIQQVLGKRNRKQQVV